MALHPPRQDSWWTPLPCLGRDHSVHGPGCRAWGASYNNQPLCREGSRGQLCPEAGPSSGPALAPRTGSLGFRPPLTPRPSPVLQSSAHAPRGLQPCDASGLGKGRASRLQGAEKPSRGPGSSWGGGDAGGLGAWQVQLLEEGAQRRHKVACVPAPAQRQALFLKKLPVWEPSFSLQTARV